MPDLDPPDFTPAAIDAIAGVVAERLGLPYPEPRVPFGPRARLQIAGIELDC